MSTIKRLLALAPFLLIGITVMAQGAGSQSGMENGSNATAFAQRLYGHIGFGASTKHDGMTPAEFSADLGYRFIPRMYAFFMPADFTAFTTKGTDRRTLRARP